ncbi:MAG: hypothetical protein AAB433_15315, partial [Nitrospirota bacterium]
CRLSHYSTGRDPLSIVMPPAGSAGLADRFRASTPGKHSGKPRRHALSARPRLGGVADGGRATRLPAARPAGARW